ncbi:MAG: hypothetical protein IKW51_09025 [Bacteroidales bacterium]|nr:hypothetical protein [Bacteroidales bacterium]
MNLNILTGIQNVLEFINNNWTAIVIILGLATAVAKKAKDFFSKSDDEKIAIAKKQIQEIMLKLITDAEEDYLTWIDAGAVKRSQVINKVFEMYPILSKVTNQEELIAWIDDVIDDSLETMREIFAKQVDDKVEISDEVEDMAAIEAE